MDWLSIGIMALGAAETTGDGRVDSMNLIARMPELMARIFLLRGGNPYNLRPRNTELGLVENFVHMLGVDGEKAERMNRVLRFFFILTLLESILNCIDHQRHDFTYGFGSIIVRRDHKVNLSRIGICIYHGENRNFQLPRFVRSTSSSARPASRFENTTRRGS